MLLIHCIGTGLNSKIHSLLSWLFPLQIFSYCVGILFCLPQRSCAGRVLGLFVSLSVSVYNYSRTAGNEAASERYQQLQCNKRSKNKMAIMLNEGVRDRETGTIEDHVA